MVGLEFLQGAGRVNPAKLSPHLAQLKHLEFIHMQETTAAEIATWRERLPDSYAVLHCPAGEN